MHIGGLSQGVSGVSVAAQRGVFRLLSTTLGYSLMLVAMTFNIGLFIAVIAGFAVGTFLFSPMIKLSSYGVYDIASQAGECH
jgi:ABC-type dipeptide/oligopeptide/nickel transport system permease component